MILYQYLNIRNFKKPYFVLVLIQIVVFLLILYWFLNDRSFQKPSNLIDMTNFHFVRNNPSLCSDVHNENGKLILVMVSSSRENYYRRKAIRKTLGEIRSFKGWEFRLIFLIGGSKSRWFTNVDDKIRIESNNDIIMGNFEDTFKMLSYKHMMGYKWTIEFCPKADFVIKIDDDTFFDAIEVYRLIKKLEGHPNWNNIQFICKKIENNSPIRNEKDDNFVPYHEFQELVFPDYCSGFAYIVKMEGLQDIYKAHQVYKMHLWVDDIWITGVLRQVSSKMFNKTEENIWNAKELFHDQDPKELVLKWYTDFTNIGTQIPWPFVSLNWGNENSKKSDKFGDFQTQMIAIWSKVLMIHLYKMEMNMTIYA